MSVRELLARLDSHELSEWMAYYRLEPFGEVRADVRAGIVASTLANVHRKRSAPPFSPLDFLAFPEPKPESDMNTKVKEVFRAFRRAD
jgi:hypothetical protein